MISMLLAILVTLVILAGLISASQAGRRDGLILHRPYNNPYSDATAAREDHLD
jgi:hypothetical protein